MFSFRFWENFDCKLTSQPDCRRLDLSAIPSLSCEPSLKPSERVSRRLLLFQVLTFIQTLLYRTTGHESTRRAGFRSGSMRGNHKKCEKVEAGGVHLVESLFRLAHQPALFIEDPLGGLAVRTMAFCVGGRKETRWSQCLCFNETVSFDCPSDPPQGDLTLGRTTKGNSASRTTYTHLSVSRHLFLIRRHAFLSIRHFLSSVSSFLRNHWFYLEFVDFSSFMENFRTCFIKVLVRCLNLGRIEILEFCTWNLPFHKDHFNFIVLKCSSRILWIASKDSCYQVIKWFSTNYTFKNFNLPFQVF